MIGHDIKEFVEKQKLGYVATVSDDNLPNLSPKGTIIVWDSKTLAFANIRSPNTIKNLTSKPNLEINVVDPLIRRGFRFGGRARVLQSGPVFDQALARYKKDGIKSKIDSIVMVDVSSMSEITSPLYDLGFTEEEIRSKWRDYLLGT